MRLDVTFDFTTDTKGYWDGFWERDPIIGKAAVDPDAKSDTLRRYQYLLNRRELPNGEFFDLKYHFKPNLIWDGMRFSSDSIIVSFRYGNYPLIHEIAKRSDYRPWVERYIRQSYTIGGEILLPMDPSINRVRGFNPSVSDRFDLTLRCIQAFYEGCTDLDDYGMNNLLNAIRDNHRFFDKFLDFKGYVDFFFLQDSVDKDYNTIMYLDYLGRPNSIEDYDLFISKEMEFLGKRNDRISKVDVADYPVVYSDH